MIRTVVSNGPPAVSVPSASPIVLLSHPRRPDRARGPRLFPPVGSRSSASTTSPVRAAQRPRRVKAVPTVNAIRASMTNSASRIAAAQPQLLSISRRRAAVVAAEGG
ncbi:t43.1 [Tupaiid betaherpesvirus 1]|uniref:T43.1 n=1 Tax=Tupaiid herpesvirus 1 (strain 1) TaxID=10397 RepID=Q91TP9_TUHV1|nr:t43.1 [Tupaiid betaherpesvirus 1]AAK57088.1 t43.1 [Tupaiid betaherpesvirus 1]